MAWHSTKTRRMFCRDDSSLHSTSFHSLERLGPSPRDSLNRKALNRKRSFNVSCIRRNRAGGWSRQLVGAPSGPRFRPLWRCAWARAATLAHRAAQHLYWVWPVWCASERAMLSRSQVRKSPSLLRGAACLEGTLSEAQRLAAENREQDC